MHIEDQLEELQKTVDQLTEKVAHLEQVANDKWLSVKELAEVMGVSTNTIYIKIRSGEIYASRKLGSPKIPISQFYETKEPEKKKKAPVKSLQDRIFNT